jgi:hypothetical protein
MYTFRVIANWWIYVYGVLIATLLADVLVFAIVHEHPTGLTGVVIDTLRSEEHSARSSGMAALFVVLAPLLNLYAVAFSASSASEAEDDIYRELDGPLSDGAPSDAHRTILIRAMGALVGILFVPLCLWFFTLHWPSLWGPERSFWFQNGFWLAVGATLVAFLIIPTYFPGLAKAIGQLESSIGDLFQRL